VTLELMSPMASHPGHRHVCSADSATVTCSHHPGHGMKLHPVMTMGKPASSDGELLALHVHYIGLRLIVVFGGKGSRCSDATSTFVSFHKNSRSVVFDQYWSPVDFYGQFSYHPFFVWCLLFLATTSIPPEVSHPGRLSMLLSSVVMERWRLFVAKFG